MSSLSLQAAANLRNLTSLPLLSLIEGAAILAYVLAEKWLLKNRSGGIVCKADFLVVAAIGGRVKEVADLMKSDSMISRCRQKWVSTFFWVVAVCTFLYLPASSCAADDQDDEDSAALR